MCIADMRIKANHENYKKYISCKAYETVNQLFEMATMTLDENMTSQELLRKIRKASLDMPDSELVDVSNVMLKATIFYERFCNLINDLLEDYKGNSEFTKKNIIDYYLFDNYLQELNFIGRQYRYDIKFKRNTSTLFRSDGETQSNWDNRCCYSKSCSETIKFIVEKCREHINTGNDKIKFISYSKCFGVVLFKYLSIHTGKESVKLNILENADINHIRYDKGASHKTVSFQEFLFDKTNNCEKLDFCIDLSVTHDGKKASLDRWIRNILQDAQVEKTAISEISEDVSVKDYSNIDLFWDIIFKRNDIPKGLQSIVSPVSDKEVIASFSQKSLDSGPSEEMNNDIPNELSFNLTNEELIHLLFSYYLNYSKKLNNHNFIDNFNKLLDKIDVMNNKKNEDESHPISEIISKIKQNSFYPNNTTIQKTNCILSYVNWNAENLDVSKNIDSIYHADTVEVSIKIMKQLLQITLR